jgi:hypothetical protein
MLPGGSRRGPANGGRRRRAHRISAGRRAGSVSARRRHVAARTPYRRLDPVGGLSRVLVLPDSHDRPSRVDETPVRVSIPGGVPVELALPPRGVRPRQRRVLRASMPEAPVYEYRDPLSREDDVGPPPQPLNRLNVHPVAQSASVQDPPQRDLRRGIPGSLAAEPTADRRAGRLRHRADPAESRCHDRSIPPRRPARRDTPPNERGPVGGEA